MSERHPPRPNDDPRIPSEGQQAIPMPGDQQLEDPAMRTLGEGAGPIKERQPAGLFLLFIVEMWERFSYYGMRALLILFMTAAIADGGFGWNERQSGPIYAWYTSLVYLLPVFGGLLADKLLGTHRSMVIGGLLIMVGHIALAAMDIFGTTSPAAKIPFFLGLGLIILGTGFFKPCVSVMVGQLYREGDRRRDSGFTIFYMGINVGAFLGALACGWLAAKYGWAYGFGAAAVGMALGLIVYFIWRPKYLKGVGLPPADPEPVGPVLAKLGALIGAFVLFGGLYLVLNNPGGNVLGVPIPEFPRMIGHIYTASLALGVIGSIVMFVRMQDKPDRGPMAALFIVSFFVVFFWLAFEQAGTSMNLFAENRTDRSVSEGIAKVIGTEEFPAAWYQSVNSFYIIVFAPIMAFLWAWLRRRRMEPNTAVKMGFGLLLLGFGFVFMVAAYYSDGGEFLRGADLLTRVAPYWLLGAYFLHTIGELCLSPIGLSLVTKLSARKWVSLMMGVWFLAPSVAQLIGGYMFAFTESIERGEAFQPIIGGQADFFLIFVITSCGAGLVMLAISPILKRLMHGRA
jgi:POT family proton-dependent oligopeptide transporter